jgi:predicted branched-subunit amino acid permease
VRDRAQGATTPGGAAAARTAVIRNALGIGVATGAYGLSFGAVSAAAGLSLLQSCALSLAMFTGASQFAFVAVAGAGGSPWAGAASAVLLGTRNALYGLRLSSLLDTGWRARPLAAHLVIDESTAMAVATESVEGGRLGFWATGVSVFVLWNVATLVGAVGAQALPRPKELGLDAAVPAAFLALLAPRMESRRLWLVALAAGAVGLASAPFVAAGLPVLFGALVAIGVGLRSAAPGDRAEGTR